MVVDFQGIYNWQWIHGVCFRGVFHHRVLASQLDQPIVSSSVQHQEHEHRLPRHKTHAAPVGSVGVVDGGVCVCVLFGGGSLGGWLWDDEKWWKFFNKTCGKTKVFSHVVDTFGEYPHLGKRIRTLGCLKDVEGPTRCSESMWMICKVSCQVGPRSDVLLKNMPRHKCANNNIILWISLFGWYFVIFWLMNLHNPY